MSIYATAIPMDGDEPEWPAPLVYRRSHVLPDDADVRGGALLLCEIPGFIRRGDRVLCDEETCVRPDCCDRVWPWLRLFVRADNESDVDHATVVLDRDQVQIIHAYLRRWLARSERRDTPNG